jgi:Family of unknown function (DUF5681)
MENDNSIEVRKITGPNGGGSLTPFPKGKSGNPKGRGKGVKSFSTIMNLILDSKVNIEVDGKNTLVTAREALMMAKVEIALRAKKDTTRLRAIESIEDRMDGRPNTRFPETQGGDDGEYVFYFPNEHDRYKDAEIIESEEVEDSE